MGYIFKKASFLLTKEENATFYANFNKVFVIFANRGIIGKRKDEKLLLNLAGFSSSSSQYR
jgi:hypothetical protein